MALDPTIVFRQFMPSAQGIQAAQQAQLKTAGIFQQLRNEQEIAPLRQAVLQGQATGQALANQQRQAQILEATRQQDLKGLASSYLQVKGAIDAGNYTEAADQLESTIMQKLQAGQTVADMSDTIQAMEALRSNDPEAIAAIKRQGMGVVEAAEAEGLIATKAGKLVERFSPTTVNLAGGVTVQTTSGGRRVVTDATGNILKGQEAADAIQAAERQEIASKIKIAKETTAARLGEQAKGVAAIEEEKIRGRVAGEAVTAPTVAKIKSTISVAVKNAEREAAKTGEKLSDLSRMEAALPGLQETVGKLRELAPIATHTLGGRLIDTAVKELGFGSTKGATARAKYTAIIRNQVLPLLKPTFGGSFTVAEGDKLEATLGDPDSTPEEKLAELDAFIENKVREIETTERELTGAKEPQASEFDPKLLEFMTPEERALFNGAN